MKFIEYKEVSLYIKYKVEFEGRNVLVTWTTEDGILEDNFTEVFKDLSNDDFEELSEKFMDELPIFSIKREDM